MVKKKKKILILGSTGMLGHTLFEYLNEIDEYELFDIVHRVKLRSESIICDITDIDQLKSEIGRIQPDYVINCIGVLVKGSQISPANAIFINSYFPHLLVQMMDEINSKLIHISTDCVFSGKKGSYAETDLRDADDIYGRTKALGEIFSERHLTLRTSIIGPEIKNAGEGLFHWFMNQNADLLGYTQAYWSGVTTLQLAENIEQSIRYNYVGLLHVTNGVSISKYELLILFQRIWNKESISIIPVNGKFINKTLRMNKEIDFNVPSYFDMLLKQFDWMKKRKELYCPLYSF